MNRIIFIDDKSLETITGGDTVSAPGVDTAMNNLGNGVDQKIFGLANAFRTLYGLD